MCGIAGWLSWDRPPEPEIVRAMCDRLVHRGPDASGVVGRGPVVLGHQRLTIIDVDPRSDQPLFDASGAYAVVFNGEIYNFRELRRELEALGAVFRTEGDTEVLVEAYKAWGVDCLERLNGMFAFALWDAPARRLFLARDRLGEKPLYWAEPGGRALVFASEPEAVACHPAVGRAADPIALGHYLALNYTVGERAFVAGVKRLLPGHALLAEAGRPVRGWRYWDLAPHVRNKRRDLTRAAAAEQLAGLIDEAVEMRMVADVPLGAFLSGGIDSATVVAAMARAREPRTVHSFSVGFEQASYSELGGARETADGLGIDHRGEVIAPDGAEILAGFALAAREPFADGSVLPTFYLSRFTRRHVKVALSGDGGDECFAGYETYLADRLHHGLRLLPKALWPALAGAVERFWPVSFEKLSFDYKLRRFLAGLALPGDRAHCSWRGIFSGDERAALVRPDLAEALRAPEADPFAVFAPHFEEVAGCHYLDQAMYVDMKTWLPDAILTKVDRASMANSLEARAPFLDHRLVEFAASLPVEMKLRGSRMKLILKESQRRRLPEAVLKRRKQGFNAPITDWLNGPLHEMARDLLASAAVGDWFRPEALDRLWDEQRRGLADNGLKLFGLVCLALWLDADAAPAAPAAPSAPEAARAPGP